MELEELKHNWELLGEQDPMWAILSVPDLKGGKWNVEEFFSTGVHDIDGFLQAARALEVEIPRGAALDFGCGMGRMTQALCPHFDSVVGVDLSNSMIRRANELNRFPEKCRYHLNTQPKLADFADCSFDFCMTFLVFQHMRPQYATQYLAELCRLLRPAGVLLFQIPVLSRIPAAERPAARAPAESDRNQPRPPPANEDPVIEMYATPLHEVARVLDDHGIAIISARSDRRAGPEFLSHEIWAVKFEQR
jgi:SAM-dependent methyltransferase